MRRHRLVTHPAHVATSPFVIEQKGFLACSTRAQPHLNHKKIQRAAPHAPLIPEFLPIHARGGRFFGGFNLRVRASVAGSFRTTRTRKTCFWGLSHGCVTVPGSYPWWNTKTNIDHTTLTPSSRMGYDDETRDYPVGSYKFGRSAKDHSVPLFLSDPEGEPEPDELEFPCGTPGGCRSRRKSWPASWWRQRWRSCSRCSRPMTCATSPSMPRHRFPPFYPGLRLRRSRTSCSSRQRTSS